WSRLGFPVHATIGHAGGIAARNATRFLYRDDAHTLRPFGVPFFALFPEPLGETSPFFMPGGTLPSTSARLEPLSCPVSTNGTLDFLRLIVASASGGGIRRVIRS